MAPFHRKKWYVVLLILWILAAVFVVAGISSLVKGQMVYGLLLIVVGFLVGPGGASLFT
ncbi:MAG: GPGG-motif small membrane protein [Acidimicrobiales bacterium]